MMITVYEGTVKHELPFTEGETILQAMQNAGIRSITAPCGGMEVTPWSGDSDNEDQYI